MEGHDVQADFETACNQPLQCPQCKRVRIRGREQGRQLNHAIVQLKEIHAHCIQLDTYAQQLLRENLQLSGDLYRQGCVIDSLNAQIEFLQKKK
jgi:hypothetical protein